MWEKDVAENLRLKNGELGVVKTSVEAFRVNETV